jgi:hypothetical protein
MDRHSVLYLSGVGSQPSRQVAAADGNLPLLWQILLAGGAPASPLDRSSPRLVINADAALLRLRCVVDFMARHPAVLARPALGWVFDGALASLREPLGGKPARYFSAELNALSWISDSAPAHFIDECRADCNARWRMVAEAIGARDHVALSRALYLTDPDDWCYWGATFGFGTLADPYFNGRSRWPDAPHPLAPTPRRSSWWRWFAPG